MVLRRGLSQEATVRETRDHACFARNCPIEVGISAAQFLSRFKGIASFTKYGRHLAFWLAIVFCCTAVARSEGPRAEFGPIITQIYLPSHPVGSVQYQPAVGVVASIRLNEKVDVDGSVEITPSKPITSTSFAGGRLTHACLGIKAGYSKGRIGFYGKARPGLLSFGDAITHLSSSGIPQLGRLTEPMIDVGAILTVRISRRFSVRYEAGDAIVRYRSRTVETGGAVSSGRTVSAVQIGTAVLWRF
jgi:hypothetical protein